MHLRRLQNDRSYRRQEGEYVCDGLKLLREAIVCGAELGSVLWGGDQCLELPADVRQFSAPVELLHYTSPLVNGPGPLFTVRIPEPDAKSRPRRVIVLENLQDPGNVGTVIRTADALCTDLVVLTGACADPWGPKAARAAMGALFRLRLLELPLEELTAALREWELPLYGAALSPRAADLRNVDLRNAAVAVGNEGHGLSEELLAGCSGEVIIPMSSQSESLNAATAAAIVMWEMRRGG
ncbi:MAG: RNA methyltransferase [Eubacteriales bacterium]|nr:RNA methyltransferase [Eubacteriales bacterium]